MKKVFAVLVLLVFATGAVFAQEEDGIKLGVWGHIGWTALEIQTWNYGDYDRKDFNDNRDTDNDLRSGLGAYWGNHHGRPVRLQFSGANEFVGFNLWLQTDNNTVATGDFASIWAKPWDFFKIELGRFNERRLRGRIGETNTNSFVLNNHWTVANNDADIIFQGFEGRPGAMISLTPIDNLFVGLKVNVPSSAAAGGTSGFAWDIANLEAKDVYGTFHGAVGFTLEDIGLARVGYLHKAPSFMYGPGGHSFDLDNFSRLEAAFALTAIDDLVIDFGLKIPFGYEREIGGEKFKITDAAVISLGARFGAGDFGIEALVYTWFGGGMKYDDKNYMTNPFGLNLHLVPSFKITDTVTASLEIGMMLTGTSTLIVDGSDPRPSDHDESTFNIGFGAFLEKNLGKGYIKAGITFTSLEVDKDWKDAADKVVPQRSGVIRIPVIMGVSF